MQCWRSVVTNSDTRWPRCAESDQERVSLYIEEGCLFRNTSGKGPQDPFTASGWAGTEAEKDSLLVMRTQTIKRLFLTGMWKHVDGAAGDNFKTCTFPGGLDKVNEIQLVQTTVVATKKRETATEWVPGGNSLLADGIPKQLKDLETGVCAGPGRQVQERGNGMRH